MYAESWSPGGGRETAVLRYGGIFLPRESQITITIIYKVIAIIVSFLETFLDSCKFSGNIIAIF